MKEYKVVQPKTGFRKFYERYEELLNQHAREGWEVCQILPSLKIVFVRDKNR
ncbi:DUF4177 domain-containing protein [uncultured Polaribacter sp.]|uniref:DUF4177 domain-containing protein n=1 Tax=uncultured Polaribacter sp. TaxID=174711 RepID=UPI00262DFE8B|nr:DUF4177 domain-containing protein [uncultured Polaribacter sp.]